MNSCNSAGTGNVIFQWALLPSSHLEFETECEKLFQFSFLKTKLKLTMVKIDLEWNGKGDLYHKNFMLWETSKKF